MKIREDARGAKLAFQDVDYLIELLEDMPENNQGPLVEKLMQIRDLQDTKYAELKSIEQQREVRRMKAQGLSKSVDSLQGHFARTTSE